MTLPLLPNTLYLLVNSVGLAAADATGLAPGKAEEWVSALEGHVAQAPRDVGRLRQLIDALNQLPTVSPAA